MEKLRKTDKDYLKGYARALQDMMFKLTGDNTCSKSYDPIDFCDEKIHSYAFDLKDGGRHHPLKDYKDIDEICELMLKEAVDYCSDKTES
jgi:hypothetical protein